MNTQQKVVFWFATACTVAGFVILFRATYLAVCGQ